MPCCIRDPKRDRSFDSHPYACLRLVRVLHNFRDGLGLEDLQQMGVSEIRGRLFWGPYNKDPTI